MDQASKLEAVRGRGEDVADQLPAAIRDPGLHLLRIRLWTVREAGTGNRRLHRDRGICRAVAVQPLVAEALPVRSFRMVVAAAFLRQANLSCFLAGLR